MKAVELLLPAVVVLLPLLLALLSGSAEAAENPGEKHRRPILAGAWYPGSETELKKNVRDFLSRATAPDEKGKLVALIAPHAGYVFSGQVAAYAYKILEKNPPSTVVVIAPSHRAYFRGVSVYDQGGFGTPLGIMPLDHDFIRALKTKEPAIRYIPEAHAQEHSLEIQIPFIQTVAPNARLVPLVMGEQDPENCKKLAVALTFVAAQRGNTVLIASSDLSHFHTDEKAKRLDRVAIDNVNSFNVQGFYDALAGGKLEACGGGPIVAVMLAAQALGADKAKVLSVANSGDVTGDRGSVVGYMSAALWSTGKKEQMPERNSGGVGVDLGLNDKEKKTLLKIARESVALKLGIATPGTHELTPVLKEKRGAFVTLKIDGQLRGCIGHIIGTEPLADTVAKMAHAAAFEDPRFTPVRKEEYPKLDFEISALTPLKLISSAEADQIKVGVHGILLRKGMRSGLLLPQVATEQGWDRNTFLDQTCRKAGLPYGAWRDKDTEIYIFSADVFGEK